MGRLDLPVWKNSLLVEGIMQAHKKKIPQWGLERHTNSSQLNVKPHTLILSLSLWKALLNVSFSLTHSLSLALNQLIIMPWDTSIHYFLLKYFPLDSTTFSFVRHTPMLTSKLFNKWNLNEQNFMYGAWFYLILFLLFASFLVSPYTHTHAHILLASWLVGWRARDRKKLRSLEWTAGFTLKKGGDKK